MSPFEEPCGIKAVEAGAPRIGIGQVAGQSAQVALFGYKFGAAVDLIGVNRHPLDTRFMRQKAVDDCLALVGLKRAGAINQRAAWLGEYYGPLDQPALQAGEFF